MRYGQNTAFTTKFLGRGRMKEQVSMNQKALKSRGCKKKIANDRRCNIASSLIRFW